MFHSDLHSWKLKYRLAFRLGWYPLLRHSWSSGQADNKRLVLLFDRSQEVHKNRVEEKIRETEDVVQEYFGHKFRVKCRLGELEKPEGAEDEDIIDDPITQAIITEFNGEIVK